MQLARDICHVHKIKVRVKRRLPSAACTYYQCRAGQRREYDTSMCLSDFRFGGTLFKGIWVLGPGLLWPRLTSQSGVDSICICEIEVVAQQQQQQQKLKKH